MDKVTVPVYSYVKPEVTSTVEIDADTLSDLSKRARQSQLAKAGIVALSSLGTGIVGATANPNAGAVQRIVNAIGAGSLGAIASKPIVDLVGARMMKGPAKRYSQEFNSQLASNQRFGLNLGEKQQLDELAIALPLALGTITIPTWVVTATTAILTAVGIHTAIEQTQNNDQPIVTPPLVDTAPVAGGGGQKPDLKLLSFAQMKSIAYNVDPFKDDRYVGDDVHLASEKYKSYKPIVDQLFINVSRGPGSTSPLKVYTGMGGGRSKKSGRFYGIGSPFNYMGSDAKQEIVQRQAYAREVSRAADAVAANSASVSRKLTIYITISLAALIAAGVAVNRVSGLVKKVRSNLKGRKASLDIIKLASMGDVEGATMLMNKEFSKSGVDLEKVAATVKDLSEDDLKIAARVLRKELS